MAKVIKNTDSIMHAYAGQEIPAGESYSLQSNESQKFAASDALIADIVSGKAQINNGITDIEGINNQISYLKGEDIGPKDSDGSPLQRIKVTTTGWHYQLQGLEFRKKNSNLPPLISAKEIDLAVKHLIFLLYIPKKKTVLILDFLILSVMTVMEMS